MGHSKATFLPPPYADAAVTPGCSGVPGSPRWKGARRESEASLGFYSAVVEAAVTTIGRENDGSAPSSETNASACNATLAPAGTLPGTAMETVPLPRPQGLMPLF